MGKDRAFKKLEIWQIGMDLMEEVYRLTATFPQSEIFGLTSQMRRASTSIPSNIAEGYGRASDKSMTYFVRVSRGSLAELDTFVDASIRLGYLSEERVQKAMQLMSAFGRKSFMFLKAIDPQAVREEQAAYGILDDSEEKDSEALDSKA
jgi:four helix bundle protein